MPDLREILAEDHLTVEALFCRLLDDEVRERWARAAEGRGDRAGEDKGA